MTGKTLYHYGRGLLIVSVVVHTLLTIFVLGIYIAGGGDDFMRTDYGEAWIVLTNRYSNVAEDFLHSIKSNLITTLGVGLFSLSNLKFPFKRGERWAWVSMWLLPKSLVENIFYEITKQSSFEILTGKMFSLSVNRRLISYRGIFIGEKN